MNDNKKFFVTELTIRVLSEDKPWNGSLQDFSGDVTEGDFVADVTTYEVVQLTADEMIGAMLAANSDPGFFGLDDMEGSE